MIKNYVISKNYAQALLETAAETDSYSTYSKQLEEVSNALKNSTDLRIVMDNSAISTTKKIEIIDEIFKNKIDTKFIA